MIRKSMFAASLLVALCAGTTLADDVVAGAVKARIERSTALSAEQKKTLAAVADAKLDAPNLGTDRKQKATAAADALVSQMFEQPLVMTNAERFPVAADYFGLSLARLAAMTPYTDGEREATAANWNTAAQGADLVIDAPNGLGALPAGIRAKIKKAVSEKLKREPKQFGVYFGVGVWKGDALSSQAASKLLLDDAFFASTCRSYVGTMQKLLARSSSATEQASSAETTVVNTLSNVVATALEGKLNQKHLDTAERFLMAAEAPAGLEMKWQGAVQKASEELQQQQAKPAAAPANNGGGSQVKDTGGVPKPAAPSH